MHAWRGDREMPPKKHMAVGPQTLAAKRVRRNSYRGRNTLRSMRRTGSSAILSLALSILIASKLMEQFIAADSTFIKCVAVHQCGLLCKRPPLVFGRKIQASMSVYLGEYGEQHVCSRVGGLVC